MSTKDFLGRGWKFPVCVDKKTGAIKLSEYEEDIEEAIKIIILTKRKERIFRSEFGCNTNMYVCEEMDETTIYALESDVIDALVKWEPRITDITVEAKRDPKNKERILLHIGYVVRDTNNMFNLVYPFYLKEGIG